LYKRDHVGPSCPARKTTECSRIQIHAEVSGVFVIVERAQTAVNPTVFPVRRGHPRQFGPVEGQGRHGGL
jgi:hypothetical protein